MLKWMSSLFALALFLALGVGNTAAPAKPPDVPLDWRGDSEERDAPRRFSFGYDFSSGSLTVGLYIPWQVLRAWLPEALGGAAADEASPQLEQARRMFEI